MEVIGILVVVGLFVLVFVLPIVAIRRSNRAIRESERLQLRLTLVERQLARMLEAPPRSSPAEAPNPGATKMAEELPRPSPKPVPNDGMAAPPVQPHPQPPRIPPIPPSRTPAPVLASVSTDAAQPAKPVPAGLTPPVKTFKDSGLGDIKGSLNWEQFMGAKLYAWIGGITLFLAAAYFVKYSFEKGWLPPEVRVALGFLLGIALLVAGIARRTKQLRVLSDTFCATGILILYGVTFACRAVYQFEFFGPAPTFALMVLITATAFLLAVRLEARVIAVLGMLGGFLTPVLLSTGRDAPLGLFVYIALLDAGVIAVAFRQAWPFLIPPATAGTILMEVGWSTKFFVSGAYYEGSKTLIPMGVLLGFNLLWLGAVRLMRNKASSTAWISWSSIALLTVAFRFAMHFQTFPGIAERPWLLLGFLFALDLIVLGLARVDRTFGNAYTVAGSAVFLFLGVWTSSRITTEQLPATLAFILIFALAHTLIPALLKRFHGDEARPSRWLAIFPPLALGAILIPVFRLTDLSLLVWPVILLVDLLALGLAALSGFVLPVLATLILTLLAATAVVLKIPAELSGLPTLLVLVGISAGLFAAGGFWLVKRSSKPGQDGMDNLEGWNRRLAALLPAFSAILPFVLLILIVGRLQITNPTPVFGLALLLMVLLFAVTRLFQMAWLPLIGLCGVALLEHAWHLKHFQADTPWVPLLWYLTFQLSFTVYPFVFKRDFVRDSGPWAASALAGPVQFYLVHQVVSGAWPNGGMGLLAAAYAIPSLVALAVVLKTVPPDAPRRQTQLALYGGSALFFITLIFPLQFSRQWITVSWAVEGAALCWLFQRVPHPGLRLTGVGLLITAFVRLALNPAVFSYHARGDRPLLNWYLYSYGIVAVSCLVAARLLAPPRDQVLGNSAVKILNTLGTILAFLLLNIQIADWFTPPGAQVLTFQFTGNFARDMSYSIGWALFALCLLIAGIARHIPQARYAALTLLGVTIAKLFFHDLAKLDTPYRIGALVAVVVVALAASFLYQKFVSTPITSDEKPPSPSTPV